MWGIINKLIYTVVIDVNHYLLFCLDQQKSLVVQQTINS